MRWVEGGIRAGRAAGAAATLGVALSAVFYLLRGLGSEMVPSGVDTRRFRLEALPKPEEFSWLVGSLAFVAFLLVPLPREGPRWAWALVRAAAGALAATLPIAALDDVWGNGAPWFAWVSVGIPAFLGLLLTAVPLPPRPGA